MINVILMSGTIMVLSLFINFTLENWGYEKAASFFDKVILPITMGTTAILAIIQYAIQYYES